MFAQSSLIFQPFINCVYLMSTDFTFTSQPFMHIQQTFIEELTCIQLRWLSLGPILVLS